MNRNKFKLLLLVFVFCFLAGTVYSVPFRRSFEQGISVQSVTARAISKSMAVGLNSASVVKASLTSGTNECIVMLVKFSGETAVKSPSDFHDILFSTAPTSMRSYYQEVSYEALTVTGTVKGWYNADYACSYYANNEGGVGGNSYPNNSQGLAVEILAKADGDIDFSDFDKDNDGYVDSVIFVFSGYYDSTGKDGNKMYPHKWEIYVSTAEGMPRGPYKTDDDGVMVKEYIVVSELTSAGAPSTDICEIGIFAHEFGHILGLPEMYDTDYTSEGLGNFCLMAGGAYGADSWSPEKPVHLNVWCKAKLGWVNPDTIDVIDGNGIRTIKNIEMNAQAYKIIANYSINGDSEYFLIVNRQKKGFDSGLFGSGLLIYHVDETVAGLEAGTPNNNETHKYVDLEEADGLEDLDHLRSYGDVDDFFTAGDSFDSASSPNSNNNSNRRIAFSVKDLSVSADDMTAYITVKAFDVNPSARKSNIFTPNYDGFNDNIVFSEATGIYTIKIMDMAGRLVKTLVNNNEWDGKYENSGFGMVDSGVYIYQIEDSNGSVISGSVVVAK